MGEANSSRIDALWENLAPHVEWPEGLSLVFLFAGHPAPVGELRGRLERSLQGRGKSLMVLDPASAEEVEGLTPVLVQEPGEDCGGVWVSLLRRAGAPGWEGAIRELLYRLNERRTLLERELAVPLVMVLPLELRMKVYEIAPDLWTVRSFVGETPEVEVPLASRVVGNRGASIGQQVVVQGSPAFGRVIFGDRPPDGSSMLAEEEWARLLATGKVQHLAAADGFAAQDSALARGDLQAARRIAMETLAVVVSQAGVAIEREAVFDVAEALAKVDPQDSRTRRLLATSLHRLGDVEMQAGDLAAARDFFQRSLDVSEAIVNTDPHDTRARRDLMIALGSLGVAEMEAGNFAVARDFFQRSLDISEAIANADPHDTRARRDLSFALNGLGNVEMLGGSLAAARDFFQRSLDIRYALVEADPHDTQARRDLSLVLSKLGDVEMLAGNLAVARDLFQRDLDVSKALAETDAQDARARRDLAFALNRLGRVEMQAGNLAVARDRLRRSLDLRQELLARDLHSNQASFDLADAHDDLARVAEHAGDRVAELDHLSQALRILEGMDARGQLAGFASREQLRDDVTRRLEALTHTPP